MPSAVAMEAEVLHLRLQVLAREEVRLPWYLALQDGAAVAASCATR